jgi:DNA-binding MarR family transcriptional regulator
MYRMVMDGGELHRLGRRLLELSAQVTGDPGDLRLTPGELAVLEDVIRHPASSVSETSERTGFAQSHVSVSVARLKARRLAETETDPADGRRTRVRAADDTVQAITRRAARSIEDTLSRTLEDPSQAGRVADLLRELAALLLPPGPRKGSQPAATAAAGVADRDREGAAAQVHRSLLM